MTESKAKGRTKGSQTLRDLAQRVPQHEDELMTIAQQLEQKGIDRDSVMEMTGLTDDGMA